MIKRKATLDLFATVWASPDAVVVHGNEWLQVMELHGHRLVTLAVKGGKHYAKCTTKGRDLGSSFFEVTDA